MNGAHVGPKQRLPGRWRVSTEHLEAGHVLPRKLALSGGTNARLSGTRLRRDLAANE